MGLFKLSTVSKHPMSHTKIYSEKLISAVFIDRDGVINQKLPGENSYVTHWKQFEFLSGALEGIRLLTGLSKRLVVVTNQRGIARGLMTESNLLAIHSKMRASITSHGGRLDGVYHCPHDRNVCQCRKPSKGLFEKARNDFPDITYARSIVVGDSEVDLQAALTIGARPVLINTQIQWRDILQRLSAKHKESTQVYPSLHAFAKAVQTGHYTL